MPRRCAAPTTLQRPEAGCSDCALVTSSLSLCSPYPQAPAGFSVPERSFSAGAGGVDQRAGLRRPGSGGACTRALITCPGGAWSAIESPTWWTSGWSGTGYQVEYSIPIIPSTGGTLQAGAGGDYKSHFVALACTT